MVYAVGTEAPRRVEVQLRNPQAATVAPTPMPGRPAAVDQQSPVMPVQMPMGIAAGRAPVVAPTPQQLMGDVNGANVAAQAAFQEHHNAWDSAAQGYMNGQKFQEDAAKTKAATDEAAKMLGDNPDLVAAVKSGAMKADDAYGIAQQRTAAAKLEVRKAKIVDFLKTSGDHDIADQYASGILDEDGVAKAIATKDKAANPTDTEAQKNLSQINVERVKAGKPELSMEDFLATKQGTTGLPGDTVNPDLPVVQLDANGAPDPDQQAEFLTHLSPTDATNIKKIANYEMDLTKVSSLKGGDRARVAALVAQFDPSFDMNQYTARTKTRQDYTAGGKVGLTITAANTAIGHLSSLYDDFTTMNNGPINALTGVTNAAKGQMSDPNLAKLRANKAAAAEELAKFFKGTGSSDMTTIAEWNTKLDETMGTDSAHQVIQDIVDKLLKTKLDELEGQYTQIMGRPRDFKIISDETGAALEKMDIQPSSLDAKSGDASLGYLTPGSGTAAAPKAPAPAPDAPTPAPKEIKADDKAGYAALPAGALYTVPGDPTQYRKK